MNTSLITYAPEPPSDRVSWTNWNKQIPGTQSVSEPSKRINQSIKHESTDRLIAINRSINESFHRWNKKIDQSVNQSTIKLFFMPKSWGYNYHWETLWSRNERQLPTPPWTQKRRQLRSLNFFINNTLVEKKRKEKNQTNKKHPFVPQQSESVYPWLLRKFVYQLRLSEVGSREQPVSSVTLGVLSTIQKNRLVINTLWQYELKSECTSYENRATYLHTGLLTASGFGSACFALYVSSSFSRSLTTCKERNILVLNPFYLQ